MVERLPALAELMKTVADAPTDLLCQKLVIGRAIALQLCIFGLDGLTLWITFLVLGQPVALWVAYTGLLAASVTAALAPMPLGLGTFEAGSVGMLVLLGVPPETALAATLLLRGVTFWLPMVPGLWFARREVKTASRQDQPRAERSASAGQSENAST